jgi:hypothetical protein
VVVAAVVAVVDVVVSSAFRIDLVALLACSRSKARGVASAVRKDKLMMGQEN